MKAIDRALQRLAAGPWAADGRASVASASMRAVAVWNGRAFGPGLRVGEQAEVWSALAGAARAWGEIKVDPGQRARALRAVADGLTAHRDEVLALAARETGLAWPRLGREMDRTIGTLRLFAEVIDPAVDATARWRRPAAVAAGGVGGVGGAALGRRTR
ncbi:MAG: aldehyde dehydrogenase family protein [bacterium]